MAMLTFLSVAGNTAFVVGEKAADIFVKELGLQKVDSPILS